MWTPAGSPVSEAIDLSNIAVCRCLRTHRTSPSESYLISAHVDMSLATHLLSARVH